jgi:hypothetical protein
VRERALIHVGGRTGCGKTTFIEALLDAGWQWVLAARCIRDNSLRRARETVPEGHAELRRYRQAGASGAALFAFPANEVGSDAFFVTRLMTDYSQGVVLEGDDPLGFVDLSGARETGPPSGARHGGLRPRNRPNAGRSRTATSVSSARSSSW